MQTDKQQSSIQLGTHGEDYGSWMSNPVFYMIGALFLALEILTFLFLQIWHIVWLGVIFGIVAVGLLLLLILITWVRKQYAFGGGGLMDQVHRTVLSYLDFDGNGTLLEVGCGSGPLAIRAALTWPNAKIIGLDYWGAVYNYSQALCEKNAVSEGVADRCTFRHGDARKLEFADESVDAVVSNYVFHNISGANKQKLLMESLRVLKKGGVFALNDSMEPQMYGDMEAFAQALRDKGYEDVRLVNTAEEVFGSQGRAALLFLPNSTMLVGRK